MFKALLRLLGDLLTVILVIVILLGGLAAFWYFRPNTAQVAPQLEMETWDAVKDNSHNSNTDLIFWKNSFYLAYVSSPFHFASDQSRLHLDRSEDGKTWNEVAKFDAAGQDIRDPKLAVIGDRLILYALKNQDFVTEPYETVAATSTDGENWTKFETLSQKGWLFWRPKTRDGQTWYVPAYWFEHNKSALLKSTDGLNWEMVSQIYEGDRNDETDIEFLPDGRMLATARLEFSDNILGHPEGSTLITIADSPYTHWTVMAKSPVTRLDGPALFTYNNRIFAVGRYQPEISKPFAWPGSIFAEKRTALFEVKLDRLVYLSDLPSAGDTSYAGVVIQNKDLYISYYTSDPQKEFPWIMGMLLPSNVCMAHVNLDTLEAFANTKDQP